jgi:hypothetical protein
LNKLLTGRKILAFVEGIVAHYRSGQPQSRCVAEVPLQPSAEHDFVDAVNIPSPRLAADVPLLSTLLGTAGRVFSHHHRTSQQPFPLPSAVVTSLSRQL